ncbi:uncharacterized protein LOC134296214 [Anolis carolinensis]|uniref:uncharacterized protein LOC134296214 n=1 Tax=Anolis carolinensis TaxID=28377 RepID=UPI002F2B338D
MFKLLTGIIADRIQDYLEEKNILPDEQKGNKWKSRGTKDQLLIDKMILENCKSRKANLHMTWIDYKKAFDSLPHNWIIKCLDAIGISKNVDTFIENMMEHWKTELFVGNESYGLVNIRRGIFQGDSLSPLLFIIAMLPLSTILQKTNLGYQTSKNSHKNEGKADKEKTWLWLTNGTLKKETEGLILAAQEQPIRTNAIKAKIEKSADDPKCRLCKETDETIDHILSCCKKIAQTDYKQRHNYVAQMIHWNLCLKYHLPAVKNWWDHKPAKVLENERAKILWNFRIQTDKVLEHNTPDITVVEKKKVWIIDVTIPGDSRIDKKQQEKLSRYQDLKIELQRLWQKAVQVVPVVMGTLGAVPKDVSRHLETIDIDKITICQLQKATLLGSARII